MSWQDDEQRQTRAGSRGLRFIPTAELWEMYRLQRQAHYRLAAIFAVATLVVLAALLATVRTNKALKLSRPAPRRLLDSGQRVPSRFDASVHRRPEKPLAAPLISKPGRDRE